MTREALHDVTQEEGQLREYVSVMRAVHDAMNEEAYKAMATATQAELADNWIPPSLGFTQLRWEWF